MVEKLSRNAKNRHLAALCDLAKYLEVIELHCSSRNEVFLQRSNQLQRKRVALLSSIQIIIYSLDIELSFQRRQENSICDVASYLYIQYLYQSWAFVT